MNVPAFRVNCAGGATSGGAGSLAAWAGFDPALEPEAPTRCHPPWAWTPCDGAVSCAKTRLAAASKLSVILSVDFISELRASCHPTMHVVGHSQTLDNK